MRLQQVIVSYGHSSDKGKVGKVSNVSAVGHSNVGAIGDGSNKGKVMLVKLAMLVPYATATTS